jgi:two-component system LytT family response regulator
MYSCFIIDDEPPCIKGLEEFINKIPEIVLIGSFESPLLALKEISLGKQPDIVFLDINMQELSGLSVADLLPKECSIVLTIGHPKYAINGFEKDTVDFLLKPYSFETFVKTIKKVRRRRGLGVQTEKDQVKSIFINPGAKVTNGISGRVTPTLPIIGTNCL